MTSPGIAEPLARVREFFEEDSARYWRERYLTPGGEQFSYVSRRALALELIGPGPGRLLDIGSGPGVFTDALLRRGFRVCAVDLAFAMLRAARALVPEHAPCRVLQGDCLQLPFRTGAFDRVLCVGVLAYLPDLGQALDELARVLRPGGLAVLQSSNRCSPTAAVHRLAKPAYRRLVRPPAGRGRIPPGCRLRAYTPGELARAAERAGLVTEAVAFYDFRPPFLDRLWPAGALRFARWLQRLERSPRLGWLGEGLVLRARRG